MPPCFSQPSSSWLTGLASKGGLPGDPLQPGQQHRQRALYNSSDPASPLLMVPCFTSEGQPFRPYSRLCPSQLQGPSHLLFSTQPHPHLPFCLPTVVGGHCRFSLVTPTPILQLLPWCLLSLSGSHHRQARFPPQIFARMCHPP